MKKIRNMVCFFLCVALSACSGHHKKILIFAGSEIQTDESQKKITVSDGTTHHEKVLDFSSSSPVSIEITSSAGKYNLDATDDGLYIANLESDTVVGSFQHTGADNGKVTYTADRLKHAIDSLQELTTGLNVHPGSGNYFIPPGKMARITANTGSKVFGPFTTVPSGFDAGSVPELYKFYTNSEVREIINKLNAFSKQSPP
jgi:hypothetical protein